MGFCSYQFNPSELYRRTRPGTAPETVCGARTFPAVDEPEVVVVRAGMGPQGALYDYVPTGGHTARAQDDPYCPDHGGSPAPPPPPVSLAELQYAYTAYTELAARFAGQPGGAIPAAASPAPAELAALAPAPVAEGVSLAPPLASATAPVTLAVPSPAEVTADQVAAARQALAGLVARAQAETGGEQR